MAYSEVITAKLKLLPGAPGVYVFRDGDGTVIYVGKASNLRNRVRSYFGSRRGLSTKVLRLVANVVDLEYTLTGSEQEALVLEADLVKRFRPQYNARLKDDKSFPLLKVDVGSPWPTVSVTRRRQNDGSLYFGPFASARSVRETLRLIRKVFRFRVCSGPLDTSRKRACLNMHIGLCPGPCVGGISQADYRMTIDRIVLFLKGRHGEVMESLVAEMKEAAAALDFERAAALRDRVQAVDMVTRRHAGVTALRGDQDILAVAQDSGQALVEVFSVRGGRALGREDFPIEGAADLSPAEVLRSFLPQYYREAPGVPPLVLLQHPVADARLIRGWLSELRGGPVALTVPRQGVRLQLMNTVADTVARELVARGAALGGEPRQRDDGLRQLKDVLGLPALPRRIEGFDISTLQGQQAVGSMVVFEKGVPKPSDYRRFKIRSVSGQDDFSMMGEVLGRRFARMARPEQGAENRSRAWAVAPDLVLVDGGRGQLGAALAARDAAGAGVRIVGLAKEHEHVFREGRSEPVDLPPDSPGLLLLEAVRDEAHRFAVAYHRNLRDSSAMTSTLDDVPGIGPRRRRSLLVAFESIEAMRDATADELARRGRIPVPLARKVKDALSARGR